jgi:hypothetical protein
MQAAKERARVSGIQATAAIEALGGVAEQSLHNAYTAFNGAPVVVPATSTTTILAASGVLPVRASGRFAVYAKVDGALGAGFTTCAIAVAIQHNGGGSFGPGLEGQVSGVANEQGAGTCIGIIASGYAVGDTYALNLTATCATAANNTLTVPNGSGTVAGAGATLTVIELP